MTEAVLELIQPTRQPSQQRPRVPVEHRAAAYSHSVNRTMSSISITHGFPRESYDLTKSYLVSRVRNALSTEGGDAPGWQGAKSENIGNI